MRTGGAAPVPFSVQCRRRSLSPAACPRSRELTPGRALASFSLPGGAVAQLGERLNGIQEADGSIPFGSTNLQHMGGSRVAPQQASVTPTEYIRYQFHRRDIRPPLSNSGADLLHGVVVFAAPRGDISWHSHEVAANGSSDRDATRNVVAVQHRVGDLKKKVEGAAGLWYPANSK